MPRTRSRTRMDLEAWHEVIALAARKLGCNGFKAFIAKPDGTLNIRKLFNMMIRDNELNDMLYKVAAREPNPMHLRNALLRLAELGYEPERTMVLKAIRGEPVDFSSLPEPRSPFVATEINLERTAVRIVNGAPGDRRLAREEGRSGRKGGFGFSEA